MKYERVLIISKPLEDAMTQVFMEAIDNFYTNRDVPVGYGNMPTKFEEPLLIIAVGGDGTMLGAMREALYHENTMVLGINTGTLGFLSDDFYDTECLFKWLQDIDDDNFIIDERMTLSGNIYINDKHIRDTIAINELALTAGSIRTPLEVKTKINDKFVSTSSGTGVLVATATGSTAMSLSSGGAIVSPSTNIMQIVPMMAHTLTARPIITTGRDVITLMANLGKHEQIEVYGDGQKRMVLNESLGNRIRVHIFKNNKKIKIIRPKDWNFFNVLSKKMKW